MSLPPPKTNDSYVRWQRCCCSVTSNFLWPCGLQHARLPCPSLSPGVCSNSCPLSQLMSSSHLIPCPLLFLPAIFPSSRMFSSELVLHQFCGYYFIIDILIKISRVYLKLINVICQLQLTKARKKNKSVILVWYNTEGEMTSQVKWKSLSHVWLCDCIVHGILQPRILQWVAFPFSRGPSQPRDRTQVSRITGRLFTSWAIREAQEDCSG